MKTLRIYIILLIVLSSVKTVSSQTKSDYQLPEAVKVELNRLAETYNILDQFSNEVWDGWNDYKNFPFQMTFQNGLRVLVGHPAPPKVYVPYPHLKVNGMYIHIDTTKLNNFELKQPLSCGGGILTLGSFNNKPVSIVDLMFYPARDSSYKSENTILVYIHELMHCYQPKINQRQSGNLRINPDLNIALYCEIEGQALLWAYEKSSLEESLPFLRDFVVARKLRTKDLDVSEKTSLANDEFSEGEAVYSEVTILNNVKKGFKSILSADDDPYYNHFSEPDIYLKRYPGNIKSTKSNTLDIYSKNYWYGCFEAILLQRYFPGWQKEVEKGAWLNQIIDKKINLTEQDSLLSVQRFHDLYNIDSLSKRHQEVISGRDELYKVFQERKGFTYIIDTKPVKQFINPTDKNYKLGLISMYPDGIKEFKFNDVSVSFKPVPIEVNQLYYIKAIDTESDKHKKPYTIEYESKDKEGFFYKVTITTPLFTLKAPKVSIRKSSNRVKFVILSRT
ncbi:MAG: hypothetical protein WC833_06630 [Bacteroidales bacterium]|jgi:hypothetical protein